MRRESLVLVCCGIVAGISAGHAARSSQPRSWSTQAPRPASAELAAESGFYLRVEPASVTRDGARERLAIQSRVGTTRSERARAIASVQIEDDRGAVIEPAKVSPRMDLAPATEIAGGEVALPALPDGWYRLRAQAVFVEPNNPKEAVGSETDSLFLEVRDGEVYVVDMTEWYARSNANLGRQL